MSILDRDLNECQTFGEISEWRTAKYEIDKKSGDDYTGILTNIYKEPTHFVYELLQNADDAKAVSVKFVLSQDKIEFFHDGSKEFSLSDIISITGVGNSSKESHDTTTIGKFGVGFKAVFAVTEKPLIYSTTYNFQIQNLSVPSEISGRDLEGFTTIFQLDFKHDKREEFFRRNEALLKSISPETILFLKNICSVDICIDNETLATTSVSRHEADLSFGRIKYQKDNDAIELLKFSDDGCSIVYQLKNDILTPITGSKISVFFPTIIDSNLPFLVDAPFQTSTTRESIDFELPHNKTLVKKFSNLFSESISKLKSLNLFTVEVFNHIMPIEKVEDSEDFPIYKVLQEAFIEDIKTKPFVPTNQDAMLSAPQVHVANDPELASLFASAPNLHFADPQLTSKATAFIAQAGAKPFGSYQLLELIDQDEINLINQTNEWLYVFYEYCLRAILNENSWTGRFLSQKIKQAPIIKTRSDSFTAAYFNDSPNVFRPSKGIPDHRTIHPMFLTESSSVSDETKARMKSFLSELGITERKPVVVLKEEYFRDFINMTGDEKLLLFEIAADIYKQSEPKDKVDIEIYLKTVAFVPSEAGEFKLASQLYSSYNADLKYLIGENHQELFCSSLVGNNADYRNFCLKLGMADQLKVEEIKQYYSNHRDELIGLYKQVASSQGIGSSTREYIRTNYDCAALHNIFSHELSMDTTSRLIPLLQAITLDQLKEYFEWEYYGTKKEVIGPSTICRLITDTSWIARDDKMVKPADISFDDFCDLYKLPRDNVLQNLTWSNDDIIKQLSVKDQELLKLAREINPTPEELLEFRRDLIEKRKRSESLSKRQSTPINEKRDYVQDEESDAADTDYNAQQEDAIVKHDDNILYASENYEAAELQREISISTKTAVNSTWSNVEQEEREVLKGLIDWYKGDGYSTEQESDDKALYILQKGSKAIKLMLLPKNNSGYNIEISEDGKIIKTIAVIKADLEKKRFTISESQWNLSKRSDMQHSIYLVSRQGDHMSQIVIGDLKERIRNGSAKTVPGVIYF